jgi:NDP-sugar pyrophosphorylase family protein
MKGMILAAGLGTRFRPATYDLPKPLVPLCNEPLIGYAIRNLADNGVREIAINLHHLPDELRRAVVERYSAFASFEFSFEPEILGTGGGIRKLRPWLEQDDEFVLVNGDTVQHPPLNELIARRRELGTVAALVLRRPPAGDRFTKVWFDGRYVTGFIEGSGEALMFAGCHTFSRRIFDLLPERDFSGITEDVYMPLTKSDPRALGAIVDDGFWFDIGTPLRYQTASDAMRQLMTGGKVAVEEGSGVEGDNLLHRTASVSGDVERSVIGPHGTIEQSARISDSVLWDAAMIGANASVDFSIIGRGVSIPAGATLRNVLVAKRLDVPYDENISLQGDFAAVAIDPSEPVLLQL